MHGYRHPSAGSQYTFDISDSPGDEALDGMQPEWSHMQNQQLQYHDYNQKSIGDLDQYPSQWSSRNIATQPFPHAQHLSASSFSSASSSLRSSQASGFSNNSLRDSVSSTASAWSGTSGMRRDQHILQAEYMLNQGSSAQSSYFPNSADETGFLTARRRPARKPVTQEKDYFKTCVSASKQSRTCSKEHRYFCTSCRRPFVEKADWKRHEETYQERPEMFECDLCPAIYFLEKDFTAHHVQSHRCGPCSGNTKWNKKTHVTAARSKRATRTGWGCGFCCHFSSDWTERCNHIAYHIEKERRTDSDWYHSNVIHSLLHRPEIYYEWMRLIQDMSLRSIRCSWNQHSTGRVEGYPDSNPTPQLQDCLEYFTRGQDAAALAQLAYRKMMQHPEPPQPIVPQPIASRPVASRPVPARERREQTLEDITRDTELWTQFINTVVEDDIRPQGVSHPGDWYPA